MKADQSESIPTRGQVSPEELRKFWQNHIGCWEVSSLSQSEYCRRQSLSLYRFSYWRRKFLKGDDPIEIVMVPSHITNYATTHTHRPEVAEPLRLTIDDRVSIDIPEQFSSTALEKVLRVMKVL